MAPPDPAELIIIGTLHGGHHTAPHYTPEVLLQILLALHPHRFCVETEARQIGEDGYALPPDDPEAERARMPDGWALREASRQLRVRLLPFEWEGSGKRYWETRQFERLRKANADLQQALARLAAADPTCVECKVAEMLDRAEQCHDLLTQNAGPELVNSEAFDQVTHIKYAFSTTLLPLLAKHEGLEEMLAEWRFIFDEWETRNDHMADNLARICDEYPGQRLVAVTGADHRYALHDRLAARPGIVLKEFWEVLEPGWSATATSC